MVTALSHEEPDRVPIDIGGGCSTSISVEGYDKLRRYLGLSGKGEKPLSELFRISRLDEDVMRYLGSDCRPLMIGPRLNWKPPRSEPGTVIDEWGITWKQIHYTGGYYWEAVKNPLAHATVEDLQNYPWPDPKDPGFTAGLADAARSLYHETDFAIVGEPGYNAVWEPAYLMRGFDKMLVDLLRNPEFVSALFSKILEIDIAIAEQFLDAVGPYIQVIRTGDDLATQQNLMFPPEIYRKMLKPIHKRFFDFIKSKTKAKLFYHSCGNIAPLIDDLVEIGVDIINPVQVSALGDTAVLKARFGEKVVFWGGIDTQYILPRGSVEEVRAEVKHRIQDLGPGGGFVLASVHNIQPDVPPQNIIAMAETAKKLGAYPIR
jgi:uroporphyrinogen decarboxylase